MAEEQFHDEPIWEPTVGAEALDGEESRTGELSLSDELGAEILPLAEASELPSLGDELYDQPTRLTPLLDPATMAGVEAEGPAAELEGELPPMAEEAVEAPPEEEPAAEEIDEAAFFIDQGLFEEAREILETVLIAYPEHVRAAQLLASMDAGPTSEPPVDEHPLTSADGKDAFDLAAELASELGELEQEMPSAEVPPPGDYQVSVEEVFAEFKKGLEKVVKPEDVDTHYDLGVAYKEMGLIDDAIAEFTVARKGCMGKRKELDCLSMIGLLQQLKGDFAGSVDAFAQALATEHAAGEVEKAIRYDLAAAYEGLGRLGKALGQYLKVRHQDPSFRDVASHVGRLEGLATPEDDDAPGPKASSGKGASGARKVGYI